MRKVLSLPVDMASSGSCSVPDTETLNSQTLGGRDMAEMTNSVFYLLLF